MGRDQNQKPGVFKLPAALIFDMDGVLVNSNPFHLQKWMDLLNEHQIPYDPAKLPEQILGHRNDTALRLFFGDKLTGEDRRRIAEELEVKFRAVFRPHAKPLDGLEALIIESHRAGIPMAVASSAMAKNLEFVVEVLGFARYFRYLISGDEVSRPKPDPEIYLTAAAKVGVPPETCVAFEDSFVGIQSALRAGIKCVAIASTFPLLELQTRTSPTLAVASFTELNLERLRGLFRLA